MTATPVCAIGILETLHEHIVKDKWVNPEAQKNVAAGVKLSVEKLVKAGFIKVDGNELAIEPVQLDLPIEDYGTLRSHQ